MIEEKKELPWETPKISMILMIFNGKVISINRTNERMININETEPLQR